MGERPVAETVVLRWTLEQREFMEVMRFRSARPRRLVAKLGFALVLVVLAGVFVLSARAAGAGAGPVSTADVGLAIGVGAAIALFLLLVLVAPRRLLALQWRRNVLLRATQEAQLGPDGAAFRSEGVETRLSWARFDDVTDTGLSYRLHLRGSGRPGMLYLIPKRAMPGPDGGARLGELLRRYISA